ncbi:MAG: homoserine dehydrogenase [Lachnospiraceae bacterium]|nr:homoserine dehydrogenase [Lachnospiraceae bacterium]
MVQVAVLGYGTVGSGVVEVIEKNKEKINLRSEAELNVKYILDLRDFPGDPYEDKVVHDINLILEDEEVKIVCETMGGIEPAFTFSKRALELGKSVCTSNKELVAAHGPELLEIAKANKCNYLFEASVGGGIPIIRPMNYSLTAEKIESITGILNGTTNYILTKMEREGADFSEVLKEAQEKGYAERNPEADVEGHDACRKIAILSSLMTGKYVKYQDIYTEGITKISAEDFRYAKELQTSIKLLGMSKDTKDGYEAMVAPFMISDDHPLHAVNGVFNAIFVHGNMLGDSMFYGRGAGKLPTASAVVSDVVDCARHLGKTIICIWDKEELSLKDYRDSSKEFFLRVKKEGWEKAKELFEIQQVVEIIDGEVGIVTKEMTERAFEEKAAKLPEMITRIRMEK